MDKINFNNHDYSNLFYGRASWLMSAAPSIFQEEDSIEEEDKEIDEDLENIDPDSLHSDLEEEDENVEDENGYEDNVEDEEVEEKQTVIEKPDAEEDYDLKDFGNHGGPDVPNNQYNEQDVEILNKLISSESDAINDYFDATTNTVDTNLSRLYGDIGREERFHLEQLLYAKSLITGEKYEPKDPEVKKEYEELIGQGMDEDTAIVTTIDKISISKPMSDEEFDEMKEDVAETEAYLIQSELLTEMIVESTFDALADEYEKRLDIYMEDVLNVNTLPKREKYGVNPIQWMIEQFWKLIKFLRKLGKMVREHLARSRAKQNRIRAYIQKYGPGAIFQKGYSFYTYDDNAQQFTVSKMLTAADLMYRTSVLIGQNCGLEYNADYPFNSFQGQFVPEKINNADQGVKMINGILLVKNRVNITDQNEEYIVNTLFGYSNSKLQYAVSDTDADGKVDTKIHQRSANFYNQALQALEFIQIAGVFCADMLKNIQALEGDPSSIYRRNYDTWKKSVKQMEDVMKGFSKIVAALNKDINTLLKIDDYVITLTQEHDVADEKHQKYEGETRKINDIPTNPDAKNSFVSRTDKPRRY